ncbi:MAG TPA: glycoside hydrolase family 9 protein, partial [Chitinophagaceae bacterium]|nr:glycoside hydrolase family 9 protein [Chitinophagaceae bacterium]
MSRNKTIYKLGIILFLLPIISVKEFAIERSWIRINQLGYTTTSVKAAIWCSMEGRTVQSWQLVDAKTNKIVTSGKAGKGFGAYGPFRNTYRLNFSSFKIPGRYYLQVGPTKSPVFEIGDHVYDGAADFCLRYMRQQRTGFNPFLKDSCHTNDGYSLYGGKAGLKDSTHVDVVGGWHDASDYLQYASTSANATYHLLMAYRDFPRVFGDEKKSNGLDGSNGIADVLDEAKWGLDWLLKMHPRDDWMFNQVADDRDHISMRMPGQDTQYGRANERPVYFVSGEPQQRGKFMNNTTGTSSTAGKFSSAFGLGSLVFRELDNTYSDSLFKKANTALAFGQLKWGVTQTASVKSPYIYAEDNWMDDLELANALQISLLKKKYNRDNDPALVFGPLHNALMFANREPITPWLGADTARHYQWYPFINIGHYELAKQLKGKKRDSLTGYYKEGIRRVWMKAAANAFYRGIPYIWCSNNLTTSFAIQCYWYRVLTGDKSFEELEQANFDWLFGCNPWGTSMVYGLPAWGDTPEDPHSAFTHLKKYPIDGGLVDGPVYTSIYKNLIGINLYNPDEYAQFQSGLAVYHDDYGDYSTNEPTMDGTASLVYLLAAKEAPFKVSYKAPYKAHSKSPPKGETYEESLNLKFSYSHGGIVRGDSTRKSIALVFTGDEFGDGA